MINPPDGAAHIYRWTERAGQPVRDWVGEIRSLDGVDIYTCGTQSTDGTTTDRITIGEHEFDRAEFLAFLGELSQPLRAIPA